jgi:hypothetical protein
LLGYPNYPEVPANSELYCFASNAFGLTPTQANATAAWLRSAFNTYRCLARASEPFFLQAHNRLSRLYQPFFSILLFLSSLALLLLAFAVPVNPAPVYSSHAFQMQANELPLACIWRCPNATAFFAALVSAFSACPHEIHSNSAWLFRFSALTNPQALQH